MPAILYLGQTKITDAGLKYVERFQGVKPEFKAGAGR
jgi:hypothetical protein